MTPASRPAVLLAAQRRTPEAFDGDLARAITAARTALDDLDAVRAGVTAALTAPATEQLTLGASQ
jgi:hypothetical protein